jgi:hypothetical protein
MADEASWDDIKKDKLNLLIEQYRIFKQEIIKYIDDVKTSSRYLYVIGWAVAAAAGFILSNKVHPNDDNWFFWVAATVLFSTTVFYSAQFFLESEYWITVLAAHMAEIESRVNELFQDNMLMWESTLAREFLKPAIMRYRLKGTTSVPVPRPTNILRILNSIALVIGVIALPLATYWYVLHFGKQSDPPIVAYHRYLLRLCFYVLTTVNILFVALIFWEGWHIFTRLFNSVRETHAKTLRESRITGSGRVPEPHDPADTAKALRASN